MALTASEKQRRYRARHLGVDGSKVRLQAFVSASCEAQLKHLACHYGYTITKMIEVLASEAENAVLDKLPAGKQRAYFDSWRP